MSRYTFRPGIGTDRSRRPDSPAPRNRIDDERDYEQDDE